MHFVYDSNLKPELDNTDDKKIVYMLNIYLTTIILNNTIFSLMCLESALFKIAISVCWKLLMR